MNRPKTDPATARAIARVFAGRVRFAVAQQHRDRDAVDRALAEGRDAFDPDGAIVPMAMIDAFLRVTGREPASPADAIPARVARDAALWDAAFDLAVAAGYRPDAID